MGLGETLGVCENLHQTGMRSSRKNESMRRDYLIALGIFIVVGAALYAMLTIFVAPGGGYVPPTSPGDLDAETLRVAKGLYCPVCPGVPLDVCATQACEQWRALIHERLSQGQSPSQIEAYFVQQYGERVLGAPRAEGFNLLVYALPALVVAAGAALLFLFARRRTLRPQPEAGGQSPVANTYLLRIEQELKENE